MVEPDIKFPVEQRALMLYDANGTPICHFGGGLRGPSFSHIQEANCEAVARLLNEAERLRKRADWALSSLGSYDPELRAHIEKSTGPADE